MRLRGRTQGELFLERLPAGFRHPRQLWVEALDVLFFFLEKGLWNHVQILDAIGTAIGKKSVRKIHIPLELMKPVVNMMEGFSFFPITNTQLTMLLEGNACNDGGLLYQTFSTKKIPFHEGIATYLR